jgi:hypothetical protein
MFVNNKNVSIFATGLSDLTVVFNAGEILKRPTRADCKSAVKTSQVRILLSPLNLKFRFQVFFVQINMIFFNKYAWW